MLKTKKVTTPSPMPIYAGAAVFAVFALVFPMIKISTILLGLGISLACVFVLRLLKIFPDVIETVTYEEPEFFASKDVEEIVVEGRKMKEQMSSLNEKIQDEQVSTLIAGIEKTHHFILEYVKSHPDSHQSIRKYMKYYVPSILELLNHFNELEETQFSGMNAESSRKRIVELLVTADAAFKKQLDSLMDQQALDITVEARVLEDLMSREGLVEKK